MTTMDLQHLSLTNLMAAHEFAPDLNPRKYGREEVDDMVAMIDAASIIVPLIGVRHPKTVDVRVIADGNRRLLARRKIAQRDKEDERKIVVPVVVIEGDAKDPSVMTKAREMALMANVGRAPLHALDQLEHFRVIYDGAITNGADAITAEQTIATRFGKTLPEVRKVLTLGGLHPTIRAAWRDGTFGDHNTHNAEQIVRAFTMIPHPEEQEKLWARLQKQKDRYNWASEIRKAAGSTRENGRIITFVGRDAYEKAGGQVVADLFDNCDAVSDVALLQRLRFEKLEATGKALVAAGWSWAEFADDLGNQHYSWAKVQGEVKLTSAEKKEIKALRDQIDKMEEREQPDEDIDPLRDKIETIEQAAEARRFSDSDKARSGVVYDFDHTGALRFTYGVIRPGTKAGGKASPKKDAKKADAQPGGISNNLMAEMSLQATHAAQEAIISTKNQNIGLIIVLSAFFNGGHVHTGPGDKGAAAGCRPGARDAQTILGKTQAISDLVDRFRNKSPGDMIELMKRAAAACVDFQIGYRKIGALDIDGALDIIGCCDKAAWNAAIEKHFDRAAFLARAPMAAAKAAIEECGGLVPSGGKDAIVKAATAITKDKGWLPSVLRTAHYAGPRAAESKTAKGAKTAKKTAKKKHK